MVSGDSLLIDLKERPIHYIKLQQCSFSQRKQNIAFSFQFSNLIFTKFLNSCHNHNDSDEVRNYFTHAQHKNRFLPILRHFLFLLKTHGIQQVSQNINHFQTLILNCKYYCKYVWKLPSSIGYKSWFWLWFGFESVFTEQGQMFYKCWDQK